MTDTPTLPDFDTKVVAEINDISNLISMTGYDKHYDELCALMMGRMVQLARIMDAGGDIDFDTTTNTFRITCPVIEDGGDTIKHSLTFPASIILRNTDISRFVIDDYKSLPDAKRNPFSRKVKKFIYKHWAHAGVCIALAMMALAATLIIYALVVRFSQ